MQVRRRDVATTGGADYASSFVASPVRAGDARAWAAAVFGGAPTPFRLLMSLGWRLGLGLRLDGDADLLGWPATADGDAVRLHATSRCVDTANVVTRSGDELRWTTVVTYRSPLGRVVWTLAALVHHRTLPWLIRRAARRSAPGS